MATKPIKQELQELTEQIVKGYQPDKIILFGSFVDGKPHKWSDYDLFIIKRTRESFYNRTRHARDAIRQYPSRGVDILVFTPQEIREPNYFIESVLTQGKILYEKTPLRKRDRALAR